MKIFFHAYSGLKAFFFIKIAEKGRRKLQMPIDIKINKEEDTNLNETNFKPSQYNRYNNFSQNDILKDPNNNNNNNNSTAQDANDIGE